MIIAQVNLAETKTGYVALFGSAPNITRRDGDYRTGEKDSTTMKENKSFGGVTGWGEGGRRLLLRI